MQSYRQRLLRRALHHNPADLSYDIDILPVIPRATLTGMRTFIGSEKSEKDLADGFVFRSITTYETEDDLEQRLKSDTARGKPALQQDKASSP